MSLENTCIVTQGMCMIYILHYLCRYMHFFPSISCLGYYLHYAYDYIVMCGGFDLLLSILD